MNDLSHKTTEECLCKEKNKTRAADVLCARATELFLERGFSCSEAAFTAMNEYMGSPLPEEMMRLSLGFRGGLGCGDVCGALTGCVMALGLATERSHAGAPSAALSEAVASLIATFEASAGSRYCRDIVADFPDRKDPARRAHCAEVVRAAVDATREILEARGGRIADEAKVGSV